MLDQRVCKKELWNRVRSMTTTSALATTTAPATLTTARRATLRWNTRSITSVNQLRTCRRSLCPLLTLELESRKKTEWSSSNCSELCRIQGRWTLKASVWVLSFLKTSSRRLMEALESGQSLAKELNSYSQSCWVMKSQFLRFQVKFQLNGKMFKSLMI